MKNYNIRINLNFSKDPEKKTPDMIDLGILYDNGNRGAFKGMFLVFGVKM